MPENLTLRDVKIYVKFETAATKQALVSNDTLPVLMGKINKWYNSLDEIAWTGHPTYIVTPTTSSATPAEGETFTAIDSLTVTNGHVTGYNTKTVTMPKSNIQDINYDSTTNELTITYSDESEETVPVGGSTYTAGDGIVIDSNDVITNEGLLSVTQDFDNKNRLTFETTYGDIVIDIPGGGGGGEGRSGSSETYVAGDAISLHDSTAPLTATLTHFKWEISQTRAKAEGTVYATLQVGEIEFYDENDQLITFSAIAGSFESDSPNPPSPSYVTTPTVQTPDKIIDNDITTKCCVTNFTSALNAMVFIFELDSTNPITAQDIKRYRYYTADDDTSADPVTWTLSVSPDGIEWFVVDTQTAFNVPTARETSTDYFTMTKPTISAKSINVKYDNGLMLDAYGNLVVQAGQGIEISNNAVTAKLGDGLTFDNSNGITLDETIDLALNCDYSQ
jgi:hypothetical protein